MSRQLRRLVRQRDGNVAITFALAFIPLVMLVGVVVDHARAIDIRARLQQAADVAALAVIREAPVLSQADFEKRARSFFDAAYPGLPGISLSRFTPTRTGAQIKIEAVASMPTTFSRLMHPEPIVVSVSSESTAGGQAIEVALVLDTTGSMNQDGKLPALKQAAKDFLTYLDKTVLSRSDAKVALVPFTTQVNLGPVTTSASWLSFTKLNQVNAQNWKGCISDRDQPYDAQMPVTAFTTANAYPAATCASVSNQTNQPTLSRIQPLGTDYAVLRTAIDAMQADGNTNVGIGVAWGMEALTPDGPLATATAMSDKRVRKIMIVLTDGDNTQNRWDQQVCGYFWGFYFCNNASAAIDARTLAACTAAKTAGIIIYTVRVIEGNETMLRSCASENGFFYNVLTAADLKPAFQSIGSSIAKFRLTQ
ncbi:pilus assembly protein TadG-related protein [Methylobacterium oryzisoli]|uniref:pilus assembly protein TadG-related protein n=1 Tax=Methylobacterium oryzisoli TaxID=3385502 RepID=UPI0038929E9D